MTPRKQLVQKDPKGLARLPDFISSSAHKYARNLTKCVEYILASVAGSDCSTNTIRIFWEARKHYGFISDGRGFIHFCGF
jgi:hypothetical protein